MKGVTPNMKKSHEYDSPVLTRLVSIVTIFAICICSICSCLCAYKISTMSGGTVAASGTQSGGSSTSGGAQSGGSSTSGGAQSGVSTSGGAQSGGSSTSGGEDSSSADGGASTGGASNEEILAKYTEVMDNLKANVASYDKKEFQNLPEDRYDLGSIGNLILPVASNLITTEDKAELQQRTDPESIPIIGNTKGCLLTDASKIKSASMTEEGGKTTIVITLVDEDNPEPVADGATSSQYSTSAMFTPLSKASIDDIVAKFEAIPTVTISSFNLQYQNCTATLVFNTETLQVESLNQTMDVYITASAKVLVTIEGYATLVNNMTINNIQYK